MADIFDTLDAPETAVAATPTTDIFDTVAEDPTVLSPLQRPKTRSLFNPEVETAMAPAYAALEKTARQGGVFGSAPASSVLDLNNVVDQFITPDPGEEGPVMKANREFQTYRDTFAKDFDLTPAEADDYLKHRFDLQKEPVSQDVFGGIHLKNDVLSRSTDEIEKEISASKLPPESKKRLELELPQRLAVFKEGVVENVRTNHPELAATYKFTGDTEKDYARIAESLNQTAGSQGVAGAVGGALRTVRDVANLASEAEAPDGFGSSREGTPARELQDYEQAQKSLTQISGDLNARKVQLLGTDAATIGAGAYSVAESVALGATTAGLGELVVPAAALARLGKTGETIAGFAKGAANVSPIAGLYGTRQAFDTYEQAIEAGKSPEEAQSLAIQAGAIEAGVTMVFSGIGLGGAEDIGARLSSEATKRTLGKAIREIGKDVVAENAEELSITALDALAVQAKINPNMTIDDLKKSLKDTLTVTTLTTGIAASASQGIERLRSAPTYELSDEELKVKADLALAAESANAAAPTTDDSTTAEPSPTDPVPAGSEQTDTTTDSAGPVDGAPAVEAEGSGTAVSGVDQESAPADIFDQLAEETPTERATRERVLPPPPGTVEEQTAFVDSQVAVRDGQIPGQETAPSEPEVGESPSNPVVPEPTAPDITQDTIPVETVTNPEIPSETITPTNENDTTPTESPPVELPVQPVPTPDAAATESSDGPAEVEVSANEGIPGETTANSPVTVPAATVEPVAENSPTGMRNAIVDQERVKRGLPPRFAPARQTNQQAWDTAVAEVDRNPNAGSNLVSRLKASPVALTPQETALFTHEQLTREQAVDTAFETLNNATEENRPAAIAAAEQAEAALVEAYDVGQVLGTISGRSLQARKLLVNQDFSLARMLAREQALANQGAPLSAKQRQEVGELHARIVELERRVSVFEAQEAETLSRQTFESAKEQLKKATAEAKKRGERPKTFIQRQADAAKERILARKREGRLNANLDPTDLFDHAVVGMSYLVDGVSTLAEFTSRLVKDFGNTIAQYAPDIFTKSQELYEGTDAPPSKVKTIDEVLESVTPESEITGRIIYNLSRAYINNGMEDFNQVMDAVLKDLRQTHPNLTLRDVHDLYSGYGRTSIPSKEKDRVQLREFRALARLTSQLEDAERGLAPLRTGVQRDKASERVRTLQKQVKEAMRRLGIKTVSPEQTLRTSLDGVKARLSNEIEELEAAIKNRKPRPENRTAVEYDAEAKTLRDQRDALKKDYDAIFGKKTMTDQERIDAAIVSVTRRIEEEDRMLAEGILSRKKTPGSSPWSPELSDLQRKLDEKQKERQKLREAQNPSKTPDEIAYDQAVAEVERGIQRYKDILSGKPKTPGSPKGRFSPDNEYFALSRERRALKTAVEAMRAAAKPVIDKDARKRAATIKALAQRVAELDRKIRAGDLSTKPGPVTNNSDPAINKLRDSQKRLSEILREMRKNALPPKDPIAVRLARDKKTIQTRIDKIRDRIAREDYAPPVKSTPVMDAEKTRLLLEEHKAKEELAERALQAFLRNRTTGKRIFDGVLEGFHAMRSIMTSFDFGAVLRQGGFVVLGNPARLARAFPANFTGWTERGAFKIRQKLEADPNYLAAKKAGLFLAENSSNVSLTRMEENYMGRWAKKIPGVSNSENAYVSFLNVLRMDSFNSLVRSLSDSGNMTDQNLKAVANYVNIATGRGNLEKFENAASAMAAIFFSPKYVASRFQLIYGAARVGLEVGTGFQLTDKSTRAARKLIALEYAKSIIGIAAIYALASLYASSQDDDDEKKMTISANPYSSDFGKLKIGNTRIDFLAGLSQTTVFMSRVLGGKTTQKGETISIRGDDAKAFSTSVFDIGARFLRSKLAPLPGAITNFAVGEDAVGDPVRPETEIISQLIPLSFGDIYSVMDEQGAAVGTPLSVLGLFGLGTATYGGEKASRLEADIASALFGTDPERYLKAKPAPRATSVKSKPLSAKPPRRMSAPTKLK